MTAWTPPPPGDRREQLPNHLLAYTLASMRPYLSTACDTATALELAVINHPDKAAELRPWAERMHARCRLNHKFTGQTCTCPCHQEPA